MRSTTAPKDLLLLCEIYYCSKRSTTAKRDTYQYMRPMNFYKVNNRLALIWNATNLFPVKFHPHDRLKWSTVYNGSKVLFVQQWTDSYCIYRCWNIHFCFFTCERREWKGYPSFNLMMKYALFFSTVGKTVSDMFYYIPINVLILLISQNVIKCFGSPQF